LNSDHTRRHYIASAIVRADSEHNPTGLQIQQRQGLVLAASELGMGSENRLEAGRIQVNLLAAWQDQVRDGEIKPASLSAGGLHRSDKLYLVCRRRV
jgi:hypothetical protein